MDPNFSTRLRYGPFVSPNETVGGLLKKSGSNVAIDSAGRAVGTFRAERKPDASPEECLDRKGEFGGDTCMVPACDGVDGRCCNDNFDADDKCALKQHGNTLKANVQALESFAQRLGRLVRVQASATSHTQAKLANAQAKVANANATHADLEQTREELLELANSAQEVGDEAEWYRRAFWGLLVLGVVVVGGLVAMMVRKK